MSSIQLRSWPGLTLIAVATLGVGLSVMLALHLSNTQIEASRRQLTDEASTFAGDLQQYLQSREMIAKTVGALFEAPDLSQPHPLGSIGKKILALTPEIVVMAWIPQVDPSRIPEVLNALSAAGQPSRLFGNALYAAGRPLRLYGPHFEALNITDIHRALYPIVDIEPDSQNHEVGLGMEIGLFPSRKAAFEQARDEKRVVATAPVGLLQPLDATGYILYSPVYDERGFVGCIMFAFRVDQLLNEFARGRRVPMNYRVYDDTDPGLLKYLVGVTRQGEIEAVNSSVRSDGAEVLQQSLDFAGRKLLVLFDSRSNLVLAGMKQALVIGSLGLILTGMVLWSMYYFMRSSRRLASEIATTSLMKVSLELVNRELSHRVGNLLAVAQGIVSLSYQTSLSPVEFRDSIVARLHALHQSVALINRTDWTGVWLRELLQTELAPVVDRIDISGRDILLKPQAAQSLSLLFYELMTNSAKHGALSKRAGRKAMVEWEIKDSHSGPLFRFRWQEHDDRIVKRPTRQGFGTKLLMRLVPGDLLGQATVNFEQGWFSYELEAPVERVVHQEANAAVNVKAIVPSASSASLQWQSNEGRS